MGPILFLIFINDISESLDFSSIKLFADDALVYMNVLSDTDRSHFQDDLDHLTGWADSNQMSFNASKCQVVVFKPNDVLSNYEMDGTPLAVVEDFRYLGVTINNGFRWDMHIDSITNKGFRTLGMIKKTLFKAPRKIKLISYITLCRPVLEFASEAWDPYLRKHVDQLERVQRQAVRFICDIKGVDSVTEGREVLGLLPLEERRKQARLKLLGQILDNSRHSFLKDSFNQIVPISSESISHNTRSVLKNQPKAMSANHNFLHNSFIHRTSRDIRGF